MHDTASVDLIDGQYIHCNKTGRTYYKTYDAAECGEKIELKTITDIDTEIQALTTAAEFLVAC